MDEADDFPRGGGTRENMREKKKKRMSKTKQGFLSASERPTPNHQLWKRKGAESKREKGEKKKKKKRSNTHRVADKKHGAEMYPTDENLFIIKQRKRSR